MMTMLGRAGLLLAVIWLAGCVHSAVNRAMLAHDQESVDQLLVKAQTALAEGRAGAATRLYEEAIDSNPGLPAEKYLALALAKAADQKLAGARATARFALQQPAQDPQTPVRLRDLLVLLYASDGLTANALDYLDPPELSAAVKISPLAQALGALREAERLAQANQPAEALLSYAEWISSYGIPDHALLRKWSDAILQTARPLTQTLVADAERAASTGEATLALHYYAQAYRYLPIAEFARTAQQPFVLTCARIPDLAALDGEALTHAQAGDAALRSHKLGEALRAYRLAVANAPWWPLLHRNLALLLASAGHFDAAVAELGWFRLLNRDLGAGLQAQRLADLWTQRGGSPGQEDRRATTVAQGSLKSERARAGRFRGAGYALLGVALGLGASSAAFAMLGAQQNNSIRAGGFATASDIQAAADRGHMYNLIGFGTLGAAGVAVIAGLPIIFVNRDPKYKLLNLGSAFGQGATLQSEGQP